MGTRRVYHKVTLLGIPSCIQGYLPLRSLILQILIVFVKNCCCIQQSPRPDGHFNVSDVLDSLLDSYDKMLRPGYQNGTPTVVKVDLNIRSMGPISEADMTYSMDTYFRQTWKDERLKFSGPIKELFVSTAILSKMWKPDTYFYNGQGSYLHTTTTPNKLLRIHSNGDILYSMRLTIKASCPMYLHYFPVDEQSCPLQFGSYAYTSDQVVYMWKKGLDESIETAKDMRLSQFDLVRTPAEMVTMKNRSGEFSTLKCHFVLQRHMGYFLIQVYIPCTLIVVLSWVSFWINREATADRVSLGILTELTLTTVSMDTRNDLPKVSYATALDWFIIMCYIFVTATLLEFAGVHYFTKIGSGEVMYDGDESEVDEEDDEDEEEDNKEVEHHQRHHHHAQCPAVHQNLPGFKDMRRTEYSNSNHTLPGQINSCRPPGANISHRHPPQYTSELQTRQNWSSCQVTNRYHGNSLSSINNHVIPTDPGSSCTCQNKGNANSKTNSHHQKENILYKFLKCLQGSAHYRKLMMQRANAYGVNTVSKIDKVSRVLFPLSFIVLNIIYWTAYTK